MRRCELQACRSAALKWVPLRKRFSVMKRFLAFFAIALLCGACAQGGSAPSSSASGITMYGTLDEGIVAHSK